MPDQGPQKPLGPPEPPKGMALYHTAPLAGKKRQRDEDDISGEEVRQQLLTDNTFTLNVLDSIVLDSVVPPPRSTLQSTTLRPSTSITKTT